ncbi:hypothetical protein J7L36_02375 [bacterium]|nr:hypothetical protein [bacterium]
MLTKIKKFLKKEIEDLGGKIRFRKFDGKKLYATITENGEKKDVYYRIEDGKLVSSWYYTE